MSPINFPRNCLKPAKRDFWVLGHVFLERNELEVLSPNPWSHPLRDEKSSNPVLVSLGCLVRGCCFHFVAQSTALKVWPDVRTSLRNYIHLSFDSSGTTVLSTYNTINESWWFGANCLAFPLVFKLRGLLGWQQCYSSTCIILGVVLWFRTKNVNNYRYKCLCKLQMLKLHVYVRLSFMLRCDNAAHIVWLGLSNKRMLG